MISPDDGRVSYLTDAPVETVALCRSGELGGRTETAAGETRLDGVLFFPRLVQNWTSVDFWVSRRGGARARHPLEDDGG